MRTLRTATTSATFFPHCEHRIRSARAARVHTLQARDIPGTGHNAHIEDPAAVVALLEQLVAGV
jgi:pimeloyl-ACP methyl ester carboxylesterase